jgi:hypothetical protein
MPPSSKSTRGPGQERKIAAQGNPMPAGKILAVVGIGPCAGAQGPSSHFSNSYLPNMIFQGSGINK